MRPTQQSAAIATLIEKCGSEDGKKEDMVIFTKYHNIFVLIQKLGDTASIFFLTWGCSNSGFPSQAQSQWQGSTG